MIEAHDEKLLLGMGKLLSRNSQRLISEMADLLSAYPCNCEINEEMLKACNMAYSFISNFPENDPGSPWLVVKENLARAIMKAGKP